MDRANRATNGGSGVGGREVVTARLHQLVAERFEDRLSRCGRLGLPLGAHIASGGTHPANRMPWSAATRTTSSKFGGKLTSASI